MSNPSTFPWSSWLSGKNFINILSTTTFPCINVSRLQWPNRFERRTYICMTDAEICVGCEFEPHLEHNFISLSFTFKCIHKVIAQLTVPRIFKKLWHKAFMFVCIVCHKPVMKQLQSLATNIQGYLLHCKKETSTFLKAHEVFRMWMLIAWRFLRYVSCYLFTRFLTWCRLYNMLLTFLCTPTVLKE